MGSQDRASLRGRIASVLANPHDGALLVTGEPGRGKSHLLRSAEREATLPTILLRINPVEGVLPLSGLSTLIAAVDPRVADFPGRFVVRSVDPVALQSASADILALLRGLRLPPTALFVDDIDLIDGVSRTFLGYMSGRLAGTGLRMIASATRLRPSDPLRGFPVVRMAPLPPDRSLELAFSAGGPSLDEGTARIAVAYSAGNPATLLSHVRGLSIEQRAGRESLRFPFPAGPVGAPIMRCALEGLDPEALPLVNALALAPLAHAGALRAAGIATVDQLDDLVRARLVEEIDPYVRLENPIVRAAVYGAIPARTRRQIHAALAETSLPAAAGIADWHASFAEPDGRRHANALLRGAIELLGDGFTGAAVELADRALLHRGDPPDIPDVLELIERLTRRGETALATRYLTRIGHGELNHRDRSRHTFARLQVDLDRAGRVPHAGVVAAVELHGDADPRGAVALLARAGLWEALRGDIAGARELLALAEPLHPRASVDAVRLSAAVAVLVGTGEPGVRPDRRSLPDPAPEPLVDASRASAPELVARARAATLQEDYGSASQLYELALELPPDEEPGWQNLARILVVDNAIRAGHVDEALAAIAALGTARMTEPLVSLRELLEAWADAASGRLDTARARLESWTAGQHGSEGGLEAAVGRALLGRLALLAGDPETAARELSHADLVAAGIGDPAVLRHLLPLVEALALSGRREAALAALARFEAAAARFPSRWATLAVASARAVVAEGERGVELFNRALAAFTPADPPLERALLLTRKGRWLRAARSPLAAAALLEARAALEMAGAVAWSPDEGLVAAGRTKENPLLGLLTEPEREVARLVQLGYQNKEIATRLFVSLRTVELRLTHIYRKTGARSRSHLVAALS